MTAEPCMAKWRYSVSVFISSFDLFPRCLLLCQSIEKKGTEWTPAGHKSGAKPVGSMLRGKSLIQIMCESLRYPKTGWWFGTWILFFHIIGNVIIPTDELIFFRGVGIPLTRRLCTAISSKDQRTSARKKGLFADTSWHMSPQACSCSQLPVLVTHLVVQRQVASGYLRFVMVSFTLQHRTRFNIPCIHFGSIWGNFMLWRTGFLKSTHWWPHFLSFFWGAGGVSSTAAATANDSAYASTAVRTHRLHATTLHATWLITGLQETVVFDK